MPIVLGIDTALSSCAFALVQDNAVLFSHAAKMTHGQDAYLHPKLEEYLSEYDVSVDALDAIAVTVGPGSFTGIRVGMAAAQGLSIALDIPCIGLTTLEALACQQAVSGEHFTVAIDTRRKDFFVQTFDAECKPLHDVRIVDEAGLADYPKPLFKDPPLDPVILAMLGVAKLRQGNTGGTLEPFYCREADAALPKNLRNIAE